MRAFLRSVFLALGLIMASQPAFPAGVIPFALTQQIDANGRPLAGCLLYIYQVGTTATPQNVFSDFGLTLPLPNPLTCDTTGRLPSFYLADGQVHVRLTDSGGVVKVDVPVMQVVGPSSGGGGGGGGSVDPSSVASSGDVKFRPTSEILTGWVKLNGLTIGSATSGATGRANNDTQNLFVYLWTNCPDAHCPVIGGRGGTALADFQANKQLTLLDWRARTPVGLDDMGASAAGRLLASNVTSGGGDGVTTPNATGGEANHTLVVAEMPSHAHTITDPTHTHSVSGTTGTESAAHTHSGSGTTSGQSADHTHLVSAVAGQAANATAGSAGVGAQAATNITSSGTSNDHTHTYSFVTGTESVLHTHSFSATSTASATGIVINANGGGGAHNNMVPFMLGTWYMKL